MSRTSHTPVAAESASPLQWPSTVPRTPSYKRRSSQKFKITFAVARKALLDALEKLGGADFVLSSNQRIRPDGLPYAVTTALSDTGVAVYFTKGGQRLCMACDTYDSVAGNIRGLGLSVEALRDLERHGSSHMVKAALVGFRALPAARPWWDVLGVGSDADSETVAKAYKVLAAKYHPDNTATGNDSEWHNLQAAMDSARANGR